MTLTAEKIIDALDTIRRDRDALKLSNEALVRNIGDLLDVNVELRAENEKFRTQIEYYHPDDHPIPYEVVKPACWTAPASTIPNKCPADRVGDFCAGCARS